MAYLKIADRLMNKNLSPYNDGETYRCGDYQWTIVKDYCILLNKKKYKNVTNCCIDAWDENQRVFITDDHIHCYGSLRTTIHLPFNNNYFTMYVNNKTCYKIIPDKNCYALDFQIFDNLLIWGVYDTFYFPSFIPYGTPLFDNKLTTVLGFVGHRTEDDMFTILSLPKTKRMMTVDSTNFFSINVQRLVSSNERGVLENNKSVYGNDILEISSKEYWENTNLTVCRKKVHCHNE